MQHTNTSMLIGFLSGLLGAASLLAHGASTALEQTIVAGELNGRFQVNGNGAATYTLPIAVPPGTNGVQPALSLAYDSQQSNGLLGVGWRLRGLSVIVRCARTLAIDGVVGAVNFDANDRFCVDGQRLINVTGDYGANGTVYQTEKNTVVRYTSHGAAGNGPAYFTAVGKDGATTEYGVTADSKIEAQGRDSVRVWAVNGVKDRNANEVSVTYTEDLQNSDYYPKSIRYTGNQTASPALNPLRQIEFNYQSRPDITSAFVAGSGVKMTRRLSNISTYVSLDGDSQTLVKPANWVSSYNLTYDVGEPTGRSRIKQIQRCGASGSCLPATMLIWQDGSDSAGEDKKFGTRSHDVPYSGAHSQWMVDVTGDSVPDFVYLQEDSKNYWVMVNTGTEFKPPVHWGTRSHDTPYSGDSQWLQDMDGDGLADLVYLQSDSKNYWVMINTGSAFNAAKYWGTRDRDIPYSGGAQWLEDMTGDGLADLMYLEEDSANYWVMVNSGSAFNPSVRWGTRNHDIANVGAQWLADMTGDGLVDFVYLQEHSRNYWVMVNTGSALRSPAHWGTRGHDEAGQWFIDMTGDGLADYVYLQKHSRNYYVLVSTGAALQAPAFWGRRTYDIPSQDGQWLVDMTGNGFPDLVYLEEDSRNYWVMTNSGFDLQPELRWGIRSRDVQMELKWGTRIHDYAWSGANSQWLMDINGDGLADFAYLAEDSRDYYVKLHSGPQPDLLTSINNGLGGAVDITSRSLSDIANNDGLYTKEHGAKGTQRDVQPPLYVVAAHSLSDGRGQTYNFEHSYAGAKSDRLRGWLGFHKTTIHRLDANAGTKQTNTYYQTYPFTGLIQNTERTKISDNTMLGASRSDYAYISQSGLFTIYLKAKEVDHYSSGNLNYVLRNEYQYDASKTKLIGAANLGDKSVNHDSVYSCYQYMSATAGSWWQGYFPIGRKVRSTGPLSNCASIDFKSWDKANDLYAQTFAYDAYMNPQTQGVYDDVKNRWVYTKYAYDAYGNTIAVTDPLGQTTNFTFDRRYRTFPEDTVSPPTNDGIRLTSREQYEPKFGVLQQIVNVDGIVTRQVPVDGIDDFGRIVITQSVNPSGKLEDTNRRSYTATTGGGMSVNTRLRQIWGASGDWDPNAPARWLWEEHYTDGIGRTYRRESIGRDQHTPLVKTWIYDSQGRLRQESLPYYTGHTKQYTVYQYDFDDRPTQVTAPNGASQYTVYSRLDDLIVEVQSPNPKDALGQAMARVTNTTTTDSRGRVIRTKAPDGSLASYQYDRLGRRVESTDPLGVVTRFSYNSLGQLITAEKPSLGKTTYSYDDAGRLIGVIDAKGQREKLTYDNLNRPIEKQVYGGNQTLLSTYSFVYDQVTNGIGKGRLTQVSTDDVIYQYVYDATGALRTVTALLDTGGSGIQTPYTTHYSYDALARLVDTTYPDGAIARVLYDYQGKISAVQFQDSGESQFTTIATYTNYNSLGQNGDAVYNNGVHTTRSYDVIGRVTDWRSVVGSTTLRQFSYDWNQANKLLRIVDKRGNPDIRLTETFSYNTVGRLVGATGPYGTKVYSYDAAGNITREDDTAYRYDTARKHQLTTGCPRTDPNCSAAALLTVNYDANGNIISKSYPKASPAYQVNYSYDGENRLTQVQQQATGSSTAATTLNTFSYDHVGRRIVKNDPISKQHTFYVSPLYEVVRQADGTQQHTRYIYGLEGVISASTKSGATAARWVAYNNAVAAASPIIGIKYAATKIVQVLSHPKLGISLNQIFLLGLLFLIVLSQIWSYGRAAATQSRVGRIRCWILKGLERCSLINHQPQWYQPAQTQWMAAHRRWRYVLPWLLLCFAVGSVLQPQVAAAAIAGDGIPQVNEVRYFHHDHLGSTVVVTDANGVETNRLVYEPYGEIDANDSTGVDNFRPKYIGKERDWRTDLYYLGARYYDQSLGRFMTPDPQGQYFSPYIYGSDDPLTHTDPDGEFAVLLTMIIVGAIVGAYTGAAIANHSFNPAEWDWKSGKTWIGIVAGAAIGAIGGAAGVAAAPEGASLAALVGVGTAVGAGEGIAYSGLQLALEAGFDGAKFSVGDVFINLAEGAAFGALAGAAGGAAGGLLGRAASRFARSEFGQSLLDTLKSSTSGLRRQLGRVTGRLGREVEEACASFAAGTAVAVEGGLKKIEDVELGDNVWSYNSSTAQVELKQVAQRFSRTVTQVVVLTIGASTIEATPEHPFYVEGKGWFEAKHLLVGDTVLKKQGDGAEVTAIRQHATNAQVYNFSVADNHNYFVGSTEVLVHNAGGCPPDELSDNTKTGEPEKVARTTPVQLQKKFKHAGDFGVSENYNRESSQKFNQAIQKHLNASTTKEISGTYRRHAVTFHTDPDSGLTVIQNQDGSFLSGWKLNRQQLQHVLEDGKL